MELRRCLVQLPAAAAAVAEGMQMLAKLEVRVAVVVLVRVPLQAAQQHQPVRAMQVVWAAIIVILTQVVAVAVLAQQAEQQLVALSRVMVELDYRHQYQVVQHTTQVEVEVVLDMEQAV